MNKKLQTLLEGSKLKYAVIKHKKVFTAYDVAATLHLKLNQVGKSLLVKTNKPWQKNKKPYVLAMVPANRNINLKKLARLMTETAKSINKKLASEDFQRIIKAEIPKENLMKSQFKVKPGAMSAFGSQYKLPVFIDTSLKGTVFLPSGSFEESIKINVSDFIKIEHPFLGNFSANKK